MKFELTNPQINLIKQIVERDLYNQTNQLNQYKIYLEVEGFTYQDEYNQKVSQEELKKRIDSLQILINHLKILYKMFSNKERS
jgi:uncharacterized protein YjdB